MNIIPGTIKEPGLNRHKVGTLEAPSGGAANMHTIKGQVAVITGAAGGIGQALALDMTRRGAAGIALVDFSDRVVQVARKINSEAGRQVAIAYRGDTVDTAFRQEVYADVTTKAGVPRICVPAAAITKDALAVRIHKQTGQVVIYPMEDFRKVVEINLIAPIYWAIELVAAVAKDRAARGLKPLAAGGRIARSSRVPRIDCLSGQRRTNLLLLDQSRLGRSCFHAHGRGDVLRGPLQCDPSGIYRHPDGAGARGRVHPDQSASANAVETADQAGGNRGCHLLYGNQRRREWRTLGRCRVAPGHLTGGQEFNQKSILETHNHAELASLTYYPS